MGEPIDVTWMALPKGLCDLGLGSSAHLFSLRSGKGRVSGEVARVKGGANGLYTTRDF